MEKDEPESEEPVPAAASVTLPTPENLARLFDGFDVVLTLTRNGKISADAKDPGADPGPIDDPIDDDEREFLLGLLNAYDAQRGEDKEPSGEHGVTAPPRK